MASLAPARPTVVRTDALRAVPNTLRTGTEAARSGTDTARSGTDTARSGTDTSRSGTDSLRSGPDTTVSGADALRTGTDTVRSGADTARGNAETEPNGAVAAKPAADTAAGQSNSGQGEAPAASGEPLTLAQAVNRTLAQLLTRDRDILVFGEDVGRKGGVYGVTKGLQQSFGVRRVFATLLDEQSVLGTALGAALAGFVPIPEIQYLAYAHNAEDQLRGEAATLSFFSGGRYRNPVVVRIAGLAYQKGFGGHFHNDNSLAALRISPAW